MTTTAELYRLESAPATTAPDLMGVFQAARTGIASISAGSTVAGTRRGDIERVRLLASLAELSIQEEAGIDRALLANADDHAWGASDPE